MWAKSILKSPFINPNIFKRAFSTNSNPSLDRTPKDEFMKIVIHRLIKTANAKARIYDLMNKKKDHQLVTLSIIQIGVKIGLTKKGCNGLTYSMNYVTKENLKKFDEVVELDNGLKIIIDNKAIMAIIGTELDYV